MRTVTLQQAKALQAQTAELARVFNTTLYKLLEVLDKTEHTFCNNKGKVQPMWQALGHDTFQEYVEESTHMHFRTAKMYLAIYRRFVVNFGYSPADLPGIGKLMRIMPIANETNHLIWVDAARKLAGKALVEKVAKARHGNLAHYNHTGLHLTLADFDAVNEAIDQAMSIGSFATRGQAMGLIAREWASMIANSRRVSRLKKTG